MTSPSRAGFESEYPFPSKFFDLDGLRYHYIDEGKDDVSSSEFGVRSAESGYEGKEGVLLCVHGNPTWSFAWRNFVKQLSPATRKPVIMFALLCGALFTGIIGTLGAIYVYELDPDQESPELEWPSWMIYLCIPLGSYLMCFRFLQVMWRFQRTGHVPHQGHGIEFQAPAPVPEPVPVSEPVPVAEPAR